MVLATRVNNLYFCGHKAILLKLADRKWKKNQTLFTSPSVTILEVIGFFLSVYLFTKNVQLYQYGQKIFKFYQYA